MGGHVAVRTPPAADVECGSNGVGCGERQPVPATHGGDGTDWRAVARWSVCAAIVLLGHGLFAAMMLRWQTGPAAAEPTAAIVVELSPLLATPEAQESEAAPTPEQIQAESASDKVVEPAETDQQRPEETLETEPEEVPSPPPVAQRDPVKNVDKEVDRESELEAPRPSEQEPVERRRHEQMAQPKPVKPAPRKPKQQAPDRATVKPQAAQVREAIAQAPAASTPSNADALPNWRSQIIDILERNKRYPPEAAARSEHGVSSLAFSLNRQGRVTSARIAGTSGSQALDEETLSLVHRVQFPPPPAEVGGAQISLIVAIRFTPRM